jgi:hypothetical protein
MFYLPLPLIEQEGVNFYILLGLFVILVGLVLYRGTTILMNEQTAPKHRYCFTFHIPFKNEVLELPEEEALITPEQGNIQME